MAIDNKLLDDLARVAGGAVSLISTVRQQVKTDLRGRMDSYADRMDFATRDEVERLQALVSSFRVEQEALKKRISELEDLIAGKTPAASKIKTQTKTKTASKKKTATSKSKRK